LPLHVPVHSVLQVAVAATVHWPLQVAVSSPWQAKSMLTGVHSAAQLVLTSHVALAETSILPQASMPAWAADDRNRGRERAPARANLTGMRMVETS
jgi:hypothetical protein